MYAYPLVKYYFCHWKISHKHNSDRELIKTYFRERWWSSRKTLDYRSRGCGLESKSRQKLNFCHSLAPGIYLANLVKWVPAFSGRGVLHIELALKIRVYVPGRRRSFASSDRPPAAIIRRSWRHHCTNFKNVQLIVKTWSWDSLTCAPVDVVQQFENLCLQQTVVRYFEKTERLHE